MNRIVLRTCLLLLLFFSSFLSGQITTNGKIGGKVLNDSITVEGVHVINKTSKKNSITDEKGFFEIFAQLNDTIVFSAVQFKLKNVIIDQKILDEGFIEVPMEIRVQELDEVTLYNPLSGDPAFDIKNSGVEKQLNFYDLGIPGSQKAPPSQSERRLQEASFGKFQWGMLTTIPLNPILNAISGRTKMLKKRVKLESEEAFLEQIKEQFEPVLIDVYGLKKEESYRFFYYCTLDEQYQVKCRNANPVVQMEFLIDQLTVFQKIEKE
ncbi:hypothetical protein [Spongiivirga citrea]|uniref:Carboxypeptidase-like regulatory domain-containing protein n=1 Tax=Spongiivirga citrea TaxID=1481457 RepID=A0A6M0CSX2_9FLAO|nr:hypothetical protein [Spongiivirga citrea]NER18607.1 hypothetical protein [Spongiivirga citrea]